KRIKVIYDDGVVEFYKTISEEKKTSKANPGPYDRDEQGQFASSGSEGGSSDSKTVPHSIKGDFTDGEKSEVREYQNGAAINGYLRDINDPNASVFGRRLAEQRLEESQWQNQMQALDSAIAKGTLTEDVTLWRGYPTALATNIPEVGETFTDY